MQRWKKLRNVNLMEPKQATVIYLFLIPHCLVHVSKIILASCPKGTTVIAYKYQMPEEDGWVPLKTCVCPDVLKPGMEEDIFILSLVTGPGEWFNLVIFFTLV